MRGLQLVTGRACNSRLRCAARQYTTRPYPYWFMRNHRAVACTDTEDWKWAETDGSQVLRIVQETMDAEHPGTARGLERAARDGYTARDAARARLGARRC